MVSVNQQIVEAILATSSRQAVFTVADIAAYANLEGAETSISKVLQRQCDGLLNLGPLVCGDSDEDRYISQVIVERWWVRQTLRWAHSGLCILTEGQLASGMSLAFDEFQWPAPPRGHFAGWPTLGDSVRGLYAWDLCFSLGIRAAREPTAF